MNASRVVSTDVVTNMCEQIRLGLIAPVAPAGPFFGEGIWWLCELKSSIYPVVIINIVVVITKTKPTSHGHKVSH